MGQNRYALLAELLYDLPQVHLSADSPQSSAEQAGHKEPWQPGQVLEDVHHKV